MRCTDLRVPLRLHSCSVMVRNKKPPRWVVYTQHCTHSQTRWQWLIAATLRRLDNPRPGRHLHLPHRSLYQQQGTKIVHLAGSTPTGTYTAAGMSVRLRWCVSMATGTGCIADSLRRRCNSSADRALFRCHHQWPATPPELGKCRDMRWMIPFGTALIVHHFQAHNPIRMEHNSRSIGLNLSLC